MDHEQSRVSLGSMAMTGLAIIASCINRGRSRLSPWAGSVLGTLLAMDTYRPCPACVKVTPEHGFVRRQSDGGCRL